MISIAEFNLNSTPLALAKAIGVAVMVEGENASAS
jgi:hypothetical protein